MEAGRPRIPPGGTRQIGLVNAAIVRVLGLGTGGRPANIFTTLARHRGLFRRWLWFAAGLMPGGRLPRRETELVILRVAHLCESEYEWGHHERIGRRAGLSQGQIERVREGAAASGWDERDRLLLESVDELHSQRRIGDELWQRLARRLDERELIELCMLTGHYEMVAMTLNSLAVVPDGRPAASPTS